ncbi:ribonuclease FAU-1 family protein [Microbacterium tumbae]
MRRAIGSTSVSASGGNATLVGRRGDGWSRVSSRELPIDEAVALLEVDGHAGAHADPGFVNAVASSADGAPRFSPGQGILWRYGRYVETARVIRDDARGLVVWIAAGSARLEPVPADGRRPRDVPMAERFRVPWVVRESEWRGQGVVRVAPTGKPWSVWFFHREDGTPDGAYINLELPHRRLEDGVFTRDLVLDLWLDAEHPGSEDVWLKDADELVAATEQGRFTAAQAEAIRCLADHAGADFLTAGGWPLDEGWGSWRPDAAMDAPIRLPDTAAIAAARARSGKTGVDG